MKVNLNLKSVGLHFDSDGITALVSIDESVNEFDEFTVSWEEVLRWGMASSQEYPDCETIVANLRAVADKLEEWNQ